MKAQRMKIVYVVHARDGQRSSSRIGVAFVEADGSMNVKLDAIPLSGELQIRNYVPCASPGSGAAAAARLAGAQPSSGPEPLGPSARA